MTYEIDYKQIDSYQAQVALGHMLYCNAYPTQVVEHDQQVSAYIAAPYQKRIAELEQRIAELEQQLADAKQQQALQFSTTQMFRRETYEQMVERVVKEGNENIKAEIRRILGADTNPIPQQHQAYNQVVETLTEEKAKYGQYVEVISIWNTGKVGRIIDVIMHSRQACVLIEGYGHYYYWHNLKPITKEEYESKTKQKGGGE